MLYMTLVFLHLLAASMALGAIVATDLRMLSKLAHQRIRIPPPNDFVARLVTIGLLLLYATGIGIVAMGLLKNPDYLANAKLQGKLVLVVLLTINAFVLHRLTFPRLARGRSLSRWRFVDWLVIVPPVALSNSLWMFCAFLGIARPWNNAIPLREVLEIAGALYLMALVLVGFVLGASARKDATGRTGRFITAMKRSLGSLGRLGRNMGDPGDPSRPRRRLAPGLPTSVARSSVAANTPLVPIRGLWPVSVQRRG